MRLIDADNLITEILMHDLIGDDKRVDKIILDAPIVKAIPIEWIKSKKIEYEHDRYDYVRGCFDGFNDCIDYLIDEWEKENETN